MKVDDNLHAHRKPRKAGVPAMGLWVLAGSWACDMLSDGFVPDYIAQSLDPDYEAHAAALVRAGLWEPDEQDEDAGWRFRDWDDYQPTKADVEKKREGARERMARVREKREESSGDVRANNERSSDPVRLTPSRPDPSRPDQEEESATKPRKRRLPTDWTPTDAHQSKAQEKRLDLNREAEAFRLHAETHDRRAVNWNSAFSMWLSKANPPRNNTIPSGRPSEGSWMIPRRAAP